MRVLAVSWAVSDHRGGGEPIGTYELVRHLAAEGVDVDVVTPELDLHDPFPGNVRTFPVRGGPRSGNTGANKRAMLREVKRLHRAHTYDVTHVMSQFTSFPVLWRPFVMSGCHVLPSASGGGARPGPVARLLRELASGAPRERVDKLRDVAYALREERWRGWNLDRTLREADLVIVRQSLGLEPFEPRTRRVVHVPFGIDLDLFPYSDAPREPVVFYAGNLHPYKNVDGLIRAFHRVADAVPDARLRIAGAGGERPRLEALVRELGLTERVTFLGHVPRYKVMEEFRRAAVFALPSWGESFGLVCLEAMASGTPVVVSDRISGAYDFSEEGVNGHMVPPDDPQRLADALAGILTDPGRGRRMGAAARRTAERFTWREVARRHVALYETL